MPVINLMYVSLPHLVYYGLESMKVDRNGDIAVVLTSPMPDLPDIEISTAFVAIRGGLMQSIRMSCRSVRHRLSQEIENALRKECYDLIEAFYGIGAK